MEILEMAFLKENFLAKNTNIGAFGTYVVFSTPYHFSVVECVNSLFFY
jgi:hypothetical protein